MLAIKRTARQRLETFANISRLKPDEETYDLERSVVGSVVAGTTADRCGQCGACDRDLVSVDVGNREDDNVVMMPTLPPHQPSSSKSIEAYANAYALAYGRAVAEACAVKCDEIAATARQKYKGKLPDQARGTSYNPHDDGRADGAWECADAICALAKEIAALAKEAK